MAAYGFADVAQATTRSVWFGVCRKCGNLRVVHKQVRDVIRCGRRDWAAFQYTASGSRTDADQWSTKNRCTGRLRGVRNQAALRAALALGGLDAAIALLPPGSSVYPWLL